MEFSELGYWLRDRKACIINIQAKDESHNAHDMQVGAPRIAENVKKGRRMMERT